MTFPMALLFPGLMQQSEIIVWIDISSESAASGSGALFWSPIAPRGSTSTPLKMQLSQQVKNASGMRILGVFARITSIVPRVKQTVVRSQWCARHSSQFETMRLKRRLGGGRREIADLGGILSGVVCARNHICWFWRILSK